MKNEIFTKKKKEKKKGKKERKSRIGLNDIFPLVEKKELGTK